MFGLSEMMTKVIIAGMILTALAGAGAWVHHVVYQKGWDARDVIAKEGLAAKDLQISLLESGVREQNKAIEKMDDLRKIAEAKGQAAMELANSKGVQYGAILAEVRGVKADSCDDAMPVVDKVIAGVRRIK